MISQFYNKLSCIKIFRKIAVIIVGILLGSMWIPGSGCEGSRSDFESNLKPNILIMVADDAGWRDVGYHGSEISTPALDKLSKTGVQLNQFYVCPTCSPTRASLLTGKYPSRFGILGPIGGKSTQALPTDVVNMASLLKKNGYQTALTGKWHLGLSLESGPNHYGFDYTYGYLHGQIDQYKHVYKFGDRTWHRNGEFVDEEGHATDLITNEAVKYLTELRDKSRPFFLQVTYSVPHFPLQEEDKWVEPYKNIIENKSRRMFAASVAHMDHSIEKIMAVIKSEKLEENTLVIFVSDNGGQENWFPKETEYNGEHGPNDVLGDNRPLRDWKKSLYEGGIRVPAIIYWPGKIEHSITNEVISVADLLPTIAALTGSQINSNAELDGKNVWNAIAEGGSIGEREIYGRTKQQIALRYGNWKLVHNGKTPGKGTQELYDLSTDPYEKNDVAEDHPDVVNNLMERIKIIAADDIIIKTPDI